MGTWDVGPFDNDGAREALAQLADGSFNLAQLQFRLIDQRADADDAEIIIALGALLAGHIPHYGVAIPEAALAQLRRADRQRWINDHIRQALEPASSDIYALWEERGEVEEWSRSTRSVMGEALG